jgi:hypothetical protein
MPNPFDAAGERAALAGFRTFGRAATYTDRNAVSVPCTVLVERDLTRYGETASVNQRTAIVQVRKSEVPSAPRRSETFTLDDGEVLVVDSLQASGDLLHRVFAS